MILTLLAVVLLGLYGLLSFGYRVAAGTHAPPLSAVVSSPCAFILPQVYVQQQTVTPGTANQMRSIRHVFSLFPPSRLECAVPALRNQQLSMMTHSNLLSMQVSRYFSALPRGLGGSRRRSGPSAAEARAALEVLRDLTAAADGSGGSGDEANLEYLSVRRVPEIGLTVTAGAERLYRSGDGLAGPTSK